MRPWKNSVCHCDCERSEAGSNPVLSRSRLCRDVPRIYTFIALAINLVFVSSCQRQQLYNDSRIMMGTFVEVTSPHRQAAQIVFSQLQRLEDLLSKYKEDSEISRLNKLGSLKVSAETLYLIKQAQEFFRLSEGAFDITVGPLLDLWGFTDKKFRLPQEAQIQDALRLAGADKIIVNEQENMIKFAFSGMKVDLGGLAKGYALDCAVEKLRQAGIKSCLINSGGQVRCLGRNFSRPWRIGIANPRGRGMVDYLELLPGYSVATSGDYEQFFFKDGRRYAHIINPQTGFPADSGVVGITVIAPDGLTADFLSTAIFVLGREKGEALAKKFAGVEVRIFEKISTSPPEKRKDFSGFALP